MGIPRAHLGQAMLGPRGAPCAVRLLLFLLLAGARESDARGEKLTRPEVILCNGRKNVTLEIRTKRLEIGPEGSKVTFNTRLYFYNGSFHFPGPTIVMKAGERCTVTLRNNISTNSYPTKPYPTHRRCPDISNVHMHGLHASPKEDDVNVLVSPGESHTYTYHIRKDHLMGTHWYHAHVHGSTALQVGGGLHGALIVEPASDYVLPADLRPLYAPSNHTLMVLSHIWIGKGDSFEGELALRSYNELASSYTNQTVPANATGSGNFYVVNGQYHPRLTMRRGSTELWRLVHAAGGKIVELSVNDTKACTFRVIARDGVFHTQASTGGSGYLDVTSLVLSPANRIDVAVMCTTLGQYTIQIKRRPENDACLGKKSKQRYYQEQLLTIVVKERTGTRTPLPTTYDAILPHRYLQDLQLVAHKSAPKQPGTGDDLKLINFAPRGDQERFGINGRSFRGYGVPEHERYLAVMRVGNVYEVTLSGRFGKEQHPFHHHPYHHHVNPFQVQSHDQCNGQVFRQGEWRDVVPSYGQSIRWINDAYVGDVMLHCHILEHEDEGMMGIFRICGEREEGGVCSVKLDPTASFIEGPISILILKLLVSSLAAAISSLGIILCIARRTVETNEVVDENEGLDINNSFKSVDEDKNYSDADTPCRSAQQDGEEVELL